MPVMSKKDLVAKNKEGSGLHSGEEDLFCSLESGQSARLRSHIKKQPRLSARLKKHRCHSPDSFHITSCRPHRIVLKIKSILYPNMVVVNRFEDWKITELFI